MLPDIDMIGEQDLEALELQLGHGHVVYTGGARGTDELRRTTGQTVWDASRSPGPPEPSSSYLHHPVDRGSPSCWPTHIFTRRRRN